MAAPVPLGWRLPSTDEIVPGLPVLGRTLAALAGAANHVNGLHARGWAPVACYQLAAETVADADDVGYIVGPAEDEDHRIAYYVPEGVDLVRVAVVGLAYETGGDAEPVVAVSAYDSAGGVVDAGFDLTRGNGSLPGGEVKVGDAYWLVPFVGEAGARTLSLAAKADEVIVLRLDTTRCMLVGVFAMPDLAVTL